MRAIRSILDQSGSVSAKNWSDPSFRSVNFACGGRADSDPADFLRHFGILRRLTGAAASMSVCRWGILRRVRSSGF
ncbi:MAG: hypothetical protein ACLR8P_18460 [Clostridium fessum]